MRCIKSGMTGHEFQNRRAVFTQMLFKGVDLVVAPRVGEKVDRCSRGSRSGFAFRTNSCALGRGRGERAHHRTGFPGLVDREAGLVDCANVRC